MRRRSGWWTIYRERQRAKHEARKARELIEQGVAPFQLYISVMPCRVHYTHRVLNEQWMVYLDAIETK